MNMLEKINRLQQLLIDVTIVTEEETVVITTRPSSVNLRPISDRKRQAIADYEQYLMELASTPHFFQSLSEEHKANLRTLSERFQTVAQENERQLSIALKTTEIISNRIKAEAKKAMGTTLQSYNANGYSTSGNEKRATPIAINQTL